jgi:hypothetical protein
MLSSCCEHERIGEAQGFVSGSQLSGTFSDRSGERDHCDAHAGDRFARVSHSIGARECDERLAVCTRWGEQLLVGSVGLIHGIDGALMVTLSSVEQPDQDARVKDQRSHSSRSWFSSPSR